MAGHITNVSGVRCKISPDTGLEYKEKILPVRSVCKWKRESPAAICHNSSVTTQPCCHTDHMLDAIGRGVTATINYVYTNQQTPQRQREVQEQVLALGAQLIQTMQNLG